MRGSRLRASFREALEIDYVLHYFLLFVAKGVFSYFHSLIHTSFYLLQKVCSSNFHSLLNAFFGLLKCYLVNSVCIGPCQFRLLSFGGFGSVLTKPYTNRPICIGFG